LVILLEREHFYTGNLNIETYGGGERKSNLSTPSYEIEDNKSGFSTDPDIFEMANEKDKIGTRNKNNINFSTNRSEMSMKSRASDRSN